MKLITEHIERDVSTGAHAQILLGMRHFLTFVGLSPVDFQHDRCLRVFRGLLSGPKICQRLCDLEYRILKPRKPSLPTQRIVWVDLLGETKPKATFKSIHH